MRITDPFALVILSALLWITLLAALRHRVVVAFGSFCLAATALVLWHLPRYFDTTNLRSAGWLIIFATALLTWRMSSSGAEKNVAAFIALGMPVLLGATLLGSVTRHPWLAHGIGLVIWLVVAISYGVRVEHLRERSRSTARVPGDELETAYSRLLRMPQDLFDWKSEQVIAALGGHSRPTLSVGEIARLNHADWAEAWILCAVLSEEGLVRLSGHGDLASAVARLTDQGGAWVKESLGEYASTPRHHVSVTILGDFVLQKGAAVMEGDVYNVSGANVTGAFGRNQLNDISSAAYGDQKVIQRDVVAAARSLADSLPLEAAGEVREAADEIDNAEEPGALRRGLQRLIGVASILGEEGRPLLGLAMRAAEGIAQ